MPLLVAAYLGGLLTLASPCVWPVLPIVFAPSGRPWRAQALPMLAGMALAFAAVGTLGGVAGAWAAVAHDGARHAALAALGLFGLALAWPALASRLGRPLVALGERIGGAGAGARAGKAAPLLLGIATGLVWAPCAGPILALVFAGAALQGVQAATPAALLAYALGAATSLGLARLAGSRLLARRRLPLRAAEGLRRAAGAAVLAAVACIALGLDARLLAPLSLDRTTALEQALLQRVGIAPAAGDSGAAAGGLVQRVSAAGPAAPGRPGLRSPPVEGWMPSLDGATAWLHTPPLTRESLRGKVVLVEFWTYSCINCLRTLPYLRAWHEKYREAGLVVLGVHTPEFAFERRTPNVQRAARDLGIGYPVAVDSDYAVWRAFGNRYWPAMYLVDAQGRVRHHQFGEGGYAETERFIQALLHEAGRDAVPAGVAAPRGEGTQAAGGPQPPSSHETYLGRRQASGFTTAGGRLQDGPGTRYAPAARLHEGQWTLAGEWTVGDESAQAGRPGGRIVHRFRARDLHLVLGPGDDGRPVRFRVRIDGGAPGADHGTDTDAEGSGRIDAQRLYQLVRQREGARERLFEIEFLDPGARAYAFTFG
ncbi:cytochrome c biogenesis protein DipZ [Aquincola sp. MAHUQ-54]|uniref:Cytochrome c biogenesis protein DipZ n=1 Tax=Aquincola agrisoli TaxID=3119538 RepID=A0AAW9QIG5_9BURK